MGSGLILLVIVGAWLAVLVPMGLRSSDSSTTTRPADRLGDAVRVLARRRPAGESAGSTSGSSERTHEERSGSTRLAGAEPAEGDSSLDRLLEQPVTAHDQSAAHDQAAAHEQATRESLPPVRRRVLPTARAEQASFRAGSGAALRFGSGPLVRRSAEPATRRSAPTAQRPTSLAVRRRRVLAVLVVLAALLLGAGLGARFAPLLVAAGVVVLLAVAFVVHCRRQTVLKAQQRRRRSAGARRALPVERTAEPVRRRRPVRRPVETTAVATTVADEQVQVPAAVAAAGASWQPVPVPLPTYVAKNQAVTPRPRAVDLPEPEAWVAALQQDDAMLRDDVDGEEIDAILDRRRAVGGW